MPLFVEIVKSLADETRYKMVMLLLNHDYCVGALARRLNISESAASQHLKVLRIAGVVKGDKRGYFTHYYVNRDLLKGLGEEIIKLSETGRLNSAHNKANTNGSLW